MLRKFPTYTDSEVDLFVESTILRLLKGSRWETVATTSDSLLLLLLNSRFASYILSLHPNDDDRTSFFEAFKHFLSCLNDVAVCDGCWSTRFECPKMFAFGGSTLIKIEIQKTILSIDRFEEFRRFLFVVLENDEIQHNIHVISIFQNIFNFNVIGFCIFGWDSKIMSFIFRRLCKY